jgi:hypothetical protein
MRSIARLPRILALPLFLLCGAALAEERCDLLRPSDPTDGLPDPSGGLHAWAQGDEARAVARLAPWLAGLREEAARAFGARPPDAKAARAFLDRWVLTASPVIRVEHHGFAFVPAIHALMTYLECRRGRLAAARRWLLTGDPLLEDPATLQHLEHLTPLER